MKRRSIEIPVKWKMDVNAKNVTVKPAITHSDSSYAVLLVVGDVVVVLVVVFVVAVAEIVVVVLVGIVVAFVTTNDGALASISMV